MSENDVSLGRTPRAHDRQAEPADELALSVDVQVLVTHPPHVLAHAFDPLAGHLVLQVQDDVSLDLLRVFAMANQAGVAVARYAIVEKGAKFSSDQGSV